MTKEIDMDPKLFRELYHELYDLKDKEKPGGDAFYMLYEALGTLARVMETYGIDVPRRFDGDGRTVANGGLPDVIRPAADDEIVKFI